MASDLLTPVLFALFVAGVMLATKRAARTGGPRGVSFAWSSPEFVGEVETVEEMLKSKSVRVYRLLRARDDARVGLEVSIRGRASLRFVSLRMTRSQAWNLGRLFAMGLAEGGGPGHPGPRRGLCELGQIDIEETLGSTTLRVQKLALAEGDFNTRLQITTRVLLLSGTVSLWLTRESTAELDGLLTRALAV